jgi:hypothetical protein
VKTPNAPADKPPTAHYRPAKPDVEAAISLASGKAGAVGDVRRPGSRAVRRGAHGVEVTKGLPCRLHSNWMSCRPESAECGTPAYGKVH